MCIEIQKTFLELNCDLDRKKILLEVGCIATFKE